eukprot:scaffold106661_cov72-Phaeocystis_antarctica.AAC.4
MPKNQPSLRFVRQYLSTHGHERSPPGWTLLLATYPPRPITVTALGLANAKRWRGPLLRCVLKAELVDGASLFSDPYPLAPHASHQAGKGGMALEPLDDQLLEVAWAHLPHRGVRLEQAEQRVVADPARRRQLPWVSGREVAHHERVELRL